MNVPFSWRVISLVSTSCVVRVTYNSVDLPGGGPS